MSTLQNAQSGKTTNGQPEKTGHDKKPIIQSQRFSHKRKQVEDTRKGGSTVAGKSLMETSNDPGSKYAQDDGTEGRGVQGTSGTDKSSTILNNEQQNTTVEGGAQDTNRKTPKRRRSRTKRKKNKSADSGEIPELQNRLPGKATEKDSESRDGIQKQEQRHLLKKAGSIDSVSQSATEGQKSSSAKEVTKKQDAVEKNKQPSQKVKGRTNTVDSSGGKDVTMVQSHVQADAMIADSRKEDELGQRGRTTHRQNRRSGSRGAVGESSPLRATQEGLEKIKDRENAQSRKENQSRNETSQTVRIESKEKQRPIPKEKRLANERQSAVLNGNNNLSENEARGRETEIVSDHVKIVSATKEGIPSSREKKAKQAINRLESQRKPPSVNAMTGFLTKTPQEIVNWLIRDHSSLFKKQLKIKDEAVAVLLKLLAKACDCESSSNLKKLFKVLSSSWLLNRRALAILNQLTGKESKTSQNKHFTMETIREMAKVQTEILRRHPTKKYPLMEKLHGLVNARKLQDQAVISVVQEQQKLLSKEKVAQCKKEAVQKRKSAKADVTDVKMKPPGKSSEPPNLEAKQTVATTIEGKKFRKSTFPLGAAEQGLEQTKDGEYATSQQKVQNGNEMSQTVGRENKSIKEGIPNETKEENTSQNEFINGNSNFSENGVQSGEIESDRVKNRSENKAEVPSSNGRKAEQAIDRLESQRKPPSVKAMTDFLLKTPQEIVKWLMLDHPSLFKRQLKIKDEAVAVLLKLLAKACDSESSSNLIALFRVLSTSWLLNRRALAILNQLTGKESKTSQNKHFTMETIREIAKVQTEILRRYPNKNYPLMEKLHRLVNARKLQDQAVISVVQEQQKLLSKEKVAQCKKEAVQKRKSAKADITDDNLKPPENFRLLSVIPTRADIISNQGQDQKLFLRKNKVEGHYNDEEHYLDVQFRLLREDFLRPLRKGIQHLMGKDVPDDTDDDNVGDVRVYKDVRILRPACTSNGVAFKIKFDVTGFSRVRWENSKRLIFGSLLCLSKDNFKSFAFATVANRELSDIRKGELEVQFVSPGGEAGIHTGDLCQMVESIAFFEAYRPVLEGLKTIPSREFPFQRYIVKCQTDVQPPAYLRKPGGHHAKFDFSPLFSNEESLDHKSSPACAPKRETPGGGLKVSGNHAGLLVSVLDPASWPAAEDLKLDDSQFNALQLALTKEFAVIQGPPGTGKTYIGLMIAKILLHNTSVWHGREGGPILVVCYTNHALDQFLEGIHAFHPEGIVRVGGRSDSETIQECSLAKIKQTRREEDLTPVKIKKTYGKIRGEMKSLSAMIDDHEEMLHELLRTLLHEDELVDYGMVQKHYDSLTRGSRNNGAKKRESVIPQWLGLPVEPADPYQEGFSQPLAMFPFNAECGSLEYFSQKNIAYLSPRVRYAPGVDGSPRGSIELTGSADSFIEIPNWLGGFADAGISITLLAFIYPLGGCGPIVSYEVHGCGVQLWHGGFEGEMGVLTACFTQRDLLPSTSYLGAAVLRMNEWNFIGASYDHDSGFARLWHDGNEVMTVFIGENSYLATQFPIRIGAIASTWVGCSFKGRISHLHIYAESLTAENIRAVGGMPSHETYRFSEENAGEAGGKNNEEQGEFDYKESSADFRFDANVLQDRRMLETDEVTRFGRESSLSHLNTNDTSDECEFPMCAHEGAPRGNWQFQNSKRIKQKIKRIIQRELQREDVMSEEEASEVEDVWNLSEKNRWRLYRRWMFDARETCAEHICDFQELYDDQVLQLKEVRKQEECEILKKADVIGMTTTGAARYHSLLQDIQPTITIVEEAAEVLEAHIVTSLTKGCKHLILIGDHQQLRPNPTVYDLQINYDLDVSLFERMVTNGMKFSRLSLQHRMRPEIAKMLDHIYVEPKLENHESVLKFENVKGVERNLFFVDHRKKENFICEGKSKSNAHEAKFLTALCRYFIQQGYQPSQITILTAYSGQLVEFRKEMIDDKEFFEGVRVTAVDNFQGEENDIILLSLVRSERIGFLKIANRVCVALSRARKGFYIIGNSTLLAEEDPNLWAKIIADMQEDGNLGSELKLVCQNHPQNVIHASCAEDFEDSPEGGCKETCMMTLECEHVCERLCHPIDLEHKEKFACEKPCTRTICDLQHICPRTCAEKCGPCMERVVKVIPGCDHEQLVPCSIDATAFKCQVRVSKETSPCGHINEVECFVAPADITCKEPCSKLECGHPCPGYCDRCQGGRLHLPCRSPCSRTLFCGHTCVDKCVKSCPPCLSKCRNHCDHQICERSCGDPCQPCVEECLWQCPHHKCTKRCGEICDRPRCDEPCSRLLSCGHVCVGVCGDICPELCRVCDAVEFRESACGAMFIELVDCGHVVEVGQLDKWMDGRDKADAQAGNDDAEIRYKVCPECRTPILYSRRYGKLVKEIRADFEAIKRRVRLADVTSIDHIQRVRQKAQEVKEIPKKLLEDIAKCGTGGRSACEEVNTCENRVTFLKFLGSLITKHKITKESNCELYDRINLLKARVMMRRDCFSEQELNEFRNELLRTKLLVSFKGLTTTLETNKSVLSLCSGDAKTVESIRSALESGKVIARNKIEEFLDDINGIEQRHGLSKKEEENFCLEKLRDEIVKSKHLTQGPWYKCKKGHIYPAAECSENEFSIKCPDCLAAARTTESHTKTVPTPVKLSEFMNATFKNEFAVSSKRRRKKRPSKTSKAHK